MKKHWLLRGGGVILAVVIGCSLFGCSKSEEQIEQELNEMTFASDEIQDTVAVINGEEVPADEYRYYLYSVGKNKMLSIDPNSTSIGSFDWEQEIGEGQKLSDVVKEEAFNQMAKDIVGIQMAKSYGFTLSDEEITTATDSVDRSLEEFGEDYVLNSIKAMGIQSVDLYKQKIQNMALLQKISDDAVINMEKYVNDPEMLKQYKQTDRVTVQHILIMKSSEQFADPLATAQEVLAKAQAGENFETLMQTYNEDTGETEAGYTFGPGEMVESFEAASFALDYDQISDIVESQYGYHIIKRKLGITELGSYWMTQVQIEKKEDILQQFDLTEIMRSCSLAENRAAAAFDNYSSTQGQNTQSATE